MTVTGRAASLRRNKRSTSQVIVAALVALAVVASLFLIFSSSVQLLRVGLVIALWAATLGAIAMTKYRRESAADKAKVRDLQTVYELQLEREITARREYESGVEARVRSETTLQASEMAALRAELAALRGNLEFLFEGRMPADRVALTADARRMGELGRGASAADAPPPVTGYRRTIDPDPEYVGAAARPSFTPDPAYAGQGRPRFATPFDAPVTAEVSTVGEDESEAPAPRAGTGTPTAAPRPEPEPVTAPQPVVDKPAPTPPTPEAVAAREPEPEPEPESGPEPEPETTAVTGRRSRRRVEPEPAPGAHSAADGLTVAEIMANMQKADAAAEPRAGRRRRD
ncbi:DUF6779 domain-containing protein [Rhodococcus kronopolitis]|uniref:DUF6779 domain-containing protein n=1 Tax=Rhodococcus kronopolitis TaxID=1460226 RepID=A0ABV9FPJ8_9NOCA